MHIFVISPAVILLEKGKGFSGRVCGKKTTGNKPHSRARVAHILANPFYYGHFRYLSEIHEGKHKGIISKQLFDRVQTVFGTARQVNKIRLICALKAKYCSLVMFIPPPLYIFIYVTRRFHTANVLILQP